MIFADAFYFIALLNDADEHHEDAVALSSVKQAILVTTDYVLLEVADALAPTRQRTQVEGFIQFVRSSSRIDVVPGDRDLFEAGLALFASRRDKQWSLTDCISFVIMESREIKDALTHDHHFKQAGFRVLL